MDSKLIFILIVVGIIVIILCNVVDTDLFHTCILNCSENNSFCKYITYDINGKNKKSLMKKPCILNIWNIYHILLFLIFTLFFPKYYLFLFVVGILWEIAEHFVGHDNWLDIVWNTIGIVLGIVLKKYI